MKKIILLATLVVVLIAGCAVPPPVIPEKTSDLVSVKVITPDFFVHKNDTIKNGKDLLWNFSVWQFGTGTNWEKWVQANPILQKPGRTWQDDQGRWYALVKIGEVLSNPERIHLQTDLKEFTKTVYVEVPSKNPNILWVGLFILMTLCVLFMFLVLRKVTSLVNKKISERDQTIGAYQNEMHKLQKELQDTKNKLPVIPPTEGVDEIWLTENNPMGNPIVDSSSDNLSENFHRRYGKKPDLIIKAVTSTSPDSVMMGFSHDRKAVTSLRKVTVYLGWEWSEEALDNDWHGIGMVAAPCANWFEINPDKVQSFNEALTEFELVGNEHPIIFLNEKVPKDQEYPKLASKIVEKFHEWNIADLKKAGAVIDFPRHNR